MLFTFQHHKHHSGFGMAMAIAFKDIGLKLLSP